MAFYKEKVFLRKQNVTQPPLVVLEKYLYIPPLHIKLDLINNFMEAMDRNGAGLQFLKTKFLRVSDVTGMYRRAYF